jgi:hypothetical protein
MGSGNKLSNAGHVIQRKRARTDVCPNNGTDRTGKTLHDKQHAAVRTRTFSDLLTFSETLTCPRGAVRTGKPRAMVVQRESTMVILSSPTPSISRAWIADWTVPDIFEETKIPSTS